jgi:hypothetical protein
VRIDRVEDADEGLGLVLFDSIVVVGDGGPAPGQRAVRVQSGQLWPGPEHRLAAGHSRIGDEQDLVGISTILGDEGSAPNLAVAVFDPCRVNGGRTQLVCHGTVSSIAPRNAIWCRQLVIASMVASGAD